MNRLNCGENLVKVLRDNYGYIKENIKDLFNHRCYIITPLAILTLPVRIPFLILLDYIAEREMSREYRESDFFTSPKLRNL